MSVHSRKRMQERYNLRINKADEQEIINLLKRNEFIPCGSSQNDPKHLKFAYVNFKHIPIKILYYRSNKKGVQQIITVYPFDVDEYNKMLEEKEREAKEKFNANIEYSIMFLKKNGYIVYKRKKSTEV